MPDKITGQVYSLKGQKGTIIGRNKQQYSFSMKDYSGSIDLEEGLLVRFKPDGKTAKNIVLSTGAVRDNGHAAFLPFAFCTLLV